MSDHPHAPMTDAAPDGPTRREPQPVEEPRIGRLRRKVAVRDECDYHDVGYLLDRLEQRDAQLASLQTDVKRGTERWYQLDHAKREAEARAEHAEAERDALLKQKIDSGLRAGRLLGPAFDGASLEEIATALQTALREREDWKEKWRRAVSSTDRDELLDRLEQTEAALAAVRQQLEQEKAK